MRRNAPIPRSYMLAAGASAVPQQKKQRHSRRRRKAASASSMTSAALADFAPRCPYPPCLVPSHSRGDYQERSRPPALPRSVFATLHSQTHFPFLAACPQPGRRADPGGSSSRTNPFVASSRRACPIPNIASYSTRNGTRSCEKSHEPFVIKASGATDDGRPPAPGCGLRAVFANLAWVSGGVNCPIAPRLFGQTGDRALRTARG